MPPSDWFGASPSGETHPTKNMTASTPVRPVTSTAQSWMPGIEVIRGIAALVVVVHHMWSLSTMPRFRWYWMVEGFGSFGVNIFFVLSAFLLSPPSWSLRTRSDVGMFWGRRAARIMPAYLANIFILFLFFVPAGALLSGVGLKQVAANLTFTHQLFPSTIGSFGANGVLWTLSVEFFLYLSLPLIGWLFSRAPFATFVTMMALGTGWRLLIGLNGDGLRSLYFGDTPVPIALQSLFVARQFVGYLPLFAIGMAARWVYENKRSWFEDRGFAMNLPFALGLLFPGVLVLVFVERSSFYTHWVWFSTFDTIIGLLIVPALLVAAAGTLAPSRVNRLAEWAGQRSYGLYLWHFPVILVAYERGIAYAPPVLNHWWARIVFVLAITAILADVSYRSIEMPAQRWAKGRLLTAGRGS